MTQGVRLYGYAPDLVLMRGPVVARAARLTGHEPRGRTPAGLWPSDHAGVVVQVEVG